MFVIEDDFVPPTNGRSGSRLRHLPDLPLSDLKVGQSFAVPHETMKYTTVKVRAWRFSQNHPVKLQVFREDGATRVYRAK